MSNQVKEEALRLYAAGFNVLPIRIDGSKHPPVEWKKYNKQRADAVEVNTWFGPGSEHYGLAIVCGETSGNLIVIDGDAVAYDIVDDAMRRLLDPSIYAIWNYAPRVKTGSGAWHKYFRCADPVEKGVKLAMRPLEVPEGTKGAKKFGDKWFKLDVVIETRGQGDIAITAPSPAPCHPNRQPYVLETGDIATPPVAERQWIDVMLSICRTFNEWVEPEQIIREPRQRKPAPQDAGCQRPGDDYNLRGDYKNLLENHGWQLFEERGEIEYWTRPGKLKCVSATFNYMNNNMLHVFSANAYPLEQDCSYDRFALFTFLEHDRDFPAAASALGKQGYGNTILSAKTTSRVDMQSGGKQGEEKTAGTTNIEKAMPRLSALLNFPFVEVEATGLRFTAQAGHNERMKTFGLLDKSQSEGTWWHNFAIADCFLAATQQEQQEMEKICLRQSHNSLQTLRNRVSVGRSWAPERRKVGVCYNFFRECSFRAFAFGGQNILLERFVNKNHPHGKIAINDLKLLKKHPDLIAPFLAGDLSVTELRQQESLAKGAPASAEAGAVPAAQADDADPLSSMPPEVSKWIHAFIQAHGRGRLISWLDEMPPSNHSQCASSQTNNNLPDKNNRVVIPAKCDRHNNHNESESSSIYTGSALSPTAEHRSHLGEFTGQDHLPSDLELLNTLFLSGDFVETAEDQRRDAHLPPGTNQVFLPETSGRSVEEKDTKQAEKYEAPDDLDDTLFEEQDDYDGDVYYEDVYGDDHSETPYSDDGISDD